MEEMQSEPFLNLQSCEQEIQMDADSSERTKIKQGDYNQDTSALESPVKIVAKRSLSAIQESHSDADTSIEMFESQQNSEHNNLLGVQSSEYERSRAEQISVSNKLNYQQDTSKTLELPVKNNRTACKRTLSFSQGSPTGKSADLGENFGAKRIKISLYECNDNILPMESFTKTDETLSASNQLDTLPMKNTEESDQISISSSGEVLEENLNSSFTTFPIKEYFQDNFESTSASDQVNTFLTKEPIQKTGYLKTFNSPETHIGQIFMETFPSSEENKSIANQQNSSPMKKYLENNSVSYQLNFLSTKEHSEKNSSAYHESGISPISQSFKLISENIAFNEPEIVLTKHCEETRSLAMPIILEAPLVKKSSLSTEKRPKKYSVKSESFRRAVNNIRKQKHPNLQLSSDSKKILDAIISDFIRIYEKEFKVMEKVKKYKTLSPEQVETATKLCLPKHLQAKAIEAARKAVLRSVEYPTAFVKNIPASDQLNIAPNGEAVEKSFKSEFPSNLLYISPFENTRQNSAVSDKLDNSLDEEYEAITEPDLSLDDTWDFSPTKIHFEIAEAKRIKLHEPENMENQPDSQLSIISFGEAFENSGLNASVSDKFDTSSDEKYEAVTGADLSLDDTWDFSPTKNFFEIADAKRIKIHPPENMENQQDSQLSIISFGETFENSGLNASVSDKFDTSSDEEYKAATGPDLSLDDTWDFSPTKIHFEVAEAKRIKLNEPENMENQQDSQLSIISSGKTKAKENPEGSVSVTLDAFLDKKPSLNVHKRPRKKEIFSKTFERAVHRIRKQNQPEMQFSSDSKIVLDEIISDFVKMYDKELKAMKKVKNYNTLLVKQIETATMLCLPKCLRDKAMEKGQEAVLKWSKL